MSLKLPSSFRKMTPQEKKRCIADLLQYNSNDVLKMTSADELSALSDVMIENAFSFLPLPLGIATGFVINGKIYNLPMVTEEPSVIAAANYGALIIGQAGGFTAEATDTIVAEQIYLEQVSAEGEKELYNKKTEIIETIVSLIPSITRRGGGYRDLDITRMSETNLVRVQVWVDVRDAMGANLLNTLGEELKPLLAGISGGVPFMSINSNDCLRKRAKASFCIPFRSLSRGSFSGETAAKRIVLASQLAQEDPQRAVTHNKGIMNGIAALALATGNDTRALEAAVHLDASRSGSYKGITQYEFSDGHLVGKIDIPLALATVGGATRFHPTSRMCLEILGNPDVKELSCIASSLGLAQNFAALWALVTEGIQKGHMKLHAKKLAFELGARGENLVNLTNMIFTNEAFSSDKAKLLYEKILHQEKKDEQ
jgi:hydroxymethylglutaryl-CoA reductase